MEPNEDISSIRVLVIDDDCTMQVLDHFLEDAHP